MNDHDDDVEIPDVYFGTARAQPVDWRKDAAKDDDQDEDEELAKTPPDVIEMLGFDPLDERE